MLGLSERLKWFHRFIASKELALGLFFFLCLILLSGTFTGPWGFPRSRTVSVVMGFIGLNLLMCTFHRIRTLSKPVLVMHLGAILTLAGSVISSFGFTATVNIYEGTSVDEVYRWDVEKDMPLGVNLTVKKINRDYYPIAVKVGVLRGGEKAGLFVLKTGESFNLERYIVKVDALELPSENLRLNVFNRDHFIGSANTSGINNLPSDFPYDFRLVAYKDPSLKMVWLDLALSKGSETVAEGTSEPNRPFVWDELNFHITKIDRDRYGLDFAGIQIRYDPGRPYVFFGFAVIGVGCVMYFMKRLVKAGRC